ncbi:MAG: hypothetical protein ACTSXQ_02780 [Alphaproteobacteria bacterium]
MADKTIGEILDKHLEKLDKKDLYGNYVALVGQKKPAAEIQAAAMELYLYTKSLAEEMNRAFLDNGHTGFKIEFIEIADLNNAKPADLVKSYRLLKAELNKEIEIDEMISLAKEESEFTQQPTEIQNYTVTGNTLDAENVLAELSYRKKQHVVYAKAHVNYRDYDDFKLLDACEKYGNTFQRIDEFTAKSGGKLPSEIALTLNDIIPKISDETKFATAFHDAVQTITFIENSTGSAGDANALGRAKAHWDNGDKSAAQSQLIIAMNYFNDEVILDLNVELQLIDPDFPIIPKTGVTDEYISTKIIGTKYAAYEGDLRRFQRAQVEIKGQMRELRDKIIPPSKDIPGDIDKETAKIHAAVFSSISTILASTEPFADRMIKLRAVLTDNNIKTGPVVNAASDEVVIEYLAEIIDIDETYINEELAANNTDLVKKGVVDNLREAASKIVPSVPVGANVSNFIAVSAKARTDINTIKPLLLALDNERIDEEAKLTDRTQAEIAGDIDTEKAKIHADVFTRTSAILSGADDYETKMINLRAVLSDNAIPGYTGSLSNEGVILLLKATANADDQYISGELDGSGDLLTGGAVKGFEDEAAGLNTPVDVSPNVLAFKTVAGQARTDIFDILPKLNTLDAERIRIEGLPTKLDIENKITALEGDIYFDVVHKTATILRDNTIDYAEKITQLKGELNGTVMPDGSTLDMTLATVTDESVIESMEILANHNTPFIGVANSAVDDLRTHAIRINDIDLISKVNNFEGALEVAKDDGNTILADGPTLISVERDRQLADAEIELNKLEKTELEEFNDPSTGEDKKKVFLGDHSYNLLKPENLNPLITKAIEAKDKPVVVVIPTYEDVPTLTSDQEKIEFEVGKFKIDGLINSSEKRELNTLMEKGIKNKGNAYYVSSFKGRASNLGNNNPAWAKKMRAILTRYVADGNSDIMAKIASNADITRENGGTAITSIDDVQTGFQANLVLGYLRSREIAKHCQDQTTSLIGTLVDESLTGNQDKINQIKVLLSTMAIETDFSNLIESNNDDNASDRATYIEVKAFDAGMQYALNFLQDAKQNGVFVDANQFLAMVENGVGTYLTDEVNIIADRILKEEEFLVEEGEMLADLDLEIPLIEIDEKDPLEFLNVDNKELGRWKNWGKKPSVQIVSDVSAPVIPLTSFLQKEIES